MKVNINSNFNLGSSFPAYVDRETEEQVVKFFDTAINANVFVSKSGRTFKVNIVVNDGIKRGVLIKASGESDDIYSAFDMALMKITRQLRKHKSKIKSYKKKMGELKAQNSDLPYILASRKILEEENKSNEIEEQKINIISEKETEIEELTVEEAIMKMDLINLPAYMFINKDNKKLNVVYRRPDGNISWINPKDNK